MESKNHKVIKLFLSDDERKVIVDWMDSLNPESTEPNHHLSVLSKSVKGKAIMFDISNTDRTNYITNFQKVSKIEYKVPSFILDIIDRISTLLDIPKEEVFLQVVDMQSGGKVSPHYDAGINGFINYKCNISVLSEDYNFYMGNDVINISEGDMYCFEASLYKHWTDEFKSRRLFMSFGFILPYEILNRNEDEPRIRLSKRIQKYFQSLN